jgi:transcriptional/translational regulatory protein YebC/TACO1
MGRHFEVRAAAMAATAKAKSAIYMRASKEIYAAAKSGIPDPDSNLALRAAIDKYRKTTPKDVIERAIEKAKGGDAVSYIQGRYEFFGPGGSFIIVDTLTDNVNRAFVSSVPSSPAKAARWVPLPITSTILASSISKATTVRMSKITSSSAMST